jgi:WD40 repeat protein
VMRHDNDAESQLRKMMHDVVAQIYPSRPAPTPGLAVTPPSRHRRSTWGVSIGLAVCVAAAALIALDVHGFGGSSNGGLGVGNEVPGALLVADTDGAVKLLAPDTGAVVRTLVGPSPVDSSGRHLGEPQAVTAADQVAYVAYGEPTPVIESIPFGGGTPQYVTTGMDPSASPDGTRLAFFRLATGSSGSESQSSASVSGTIVLRDLATGSEQTVDAMTGFSFVEALSWSPDGTRLALSGPFTPNTTTGLLSDLVVGVQILTVDQPTSATNPRFLGTPDTVGDIGAGTPEWTDGQFLDSGGSVAVLASSNPGGACQATHTSVLLVDPATGRTTTVATMPFSVSHAVFDPAGNLVALQRALPPRNCHEVTTTTTTSTTVPGRLGIGFSTGTAFFSESQLVLDRWSAGESSELTAGIAAVTFVAQSP